MAELNEAESTKDAKKTKKEKKMEEKAAKKAAKKAKKNHEADKPDAENDDSDSVSSKIVMVLVTILIIAIWLGIFAVFVKADVGGFGSTVLAPALKDVPVLSKILPDSGTITASESTETAGYTNLDDAVSRIKELEKQLDDANSKNQADAQTINDLNAQIQDLSTYKEEQAAFEEEKEKYYEEVVFSDKAPDIKEYKKFYEQVDPANAEILYKSRLVRGCNYYNRARHTLRAKIPFYELPNLPASLSNQGNYIDICLCVAGKHTKKSTFTDS